MDTLTLITLSTIVCAMACAFTMMVAQRVAEEAEKQRQEKMLAAIDSAIETHNDFHIDAKGENIWDYYVAIDNALTNIRREVVKL